MVLRIFHANQSDLHLVYDRAVSFDIIVFVCLVSISSRWGPSRTAFYRIVSSCANLVPFSAYNIKRAPVFSLTYLNHSWRLSTATATRRAFAANDQTCRWSGNHLFLESEMDTVKQSTRRSAYCILIKARKD